MNHHYLEGADLFSIADYLEVAIGWKLSLKQFKKYLKNRGYYVRIIKDVSSPATAEYDNKRVNIKVKNGKIVKIFGIY